MHAEVKIIIKMWQINNWKNKTTKGKKKKTKKIKYLRG